VYIDVEGNGEGYSLIVDDDGTHPATEVSGLAVLHDTGWFPVLVQFFEAEGEQVMKFKYSGPDTDYNKDYVEGWHLPPPPPPSAAGATANGATSASTTSTASTASTGGTSEAAAGGDAATGAADAATATGGAEAGTGGGDSEGGAAGSAGGAEAGTGGGDSEGGDGGDGSEDSGGDGGDGDETESDEETATKKEYETNWDELGNRKTHYLDRHDVDCQGAPINGFQMRTRGEGDARQISYKFTCLEGVNFDVSETKNTAVQEDGDDLIFLDRQKVDCGDNAAISQFHLLRDGDWHNHYEYTCATTDLPISLVECTDHTTPRNEGGEGGHRLEFLDRHDVQCPKKQVLTQFQMQTVDSGLPIGKIFYQYTCCSVAGLKVWESCEESFSGVRGNIGGATGTALCCSAKCDQCGKLNCEAANSVAKQTMGLDWVKANCCPKLNEISKCKKEDAEPPCKCKKQGKCRREPPKYGLTLVASGCCNKSPSTEQIDYWQKHSPATVLSDMRDYCEVNKAGTANDWQKSICGCGDTPPTTCQLQSAFSYEPPPPDAPPPEPMPVGTSMLNNECAKWRDGDNQLKSKQLYNMVKCMQQDCAQSMEEITCDYVTPESGGTAKAGLCYTNPGQIFCKENPTSPDCKKVETKWMPVQNIPFRYVKVYSARDVG
jgi:hypothetical protein